MRFAGYRRGGGTGHRVLGSAGKCPSIFEWQPKNLSVSTSFFVSVSVLASIACLCNKSTSPLALWVTETRSTTKVPPNIHGMSEQQTRGLEGFAQRKLVKIHVASYLAILSTFCVLSVSACCFVALVPETETEGHYAYRSSYPAHQVRPRQIHQSQ